MKTILARFFPLLVVFGGMCLLVGGAMPVAAAEDEDSANAEEKINLYLQNLAEEERERWTGRMMTVIDDIDRVCLLRPAQRAKLELAAKGAIDRGVNGWREQMDNWVRARAKNAQGDLDQFLAGVGAVRFGDSSRNWEPERQDLWRTNLEGALDSSQLKAYKADILARYAFKHEAMARAVVADLDRSLRFSEDQRENVLKLVQKASETYWERLEVWAGDDENLPYHQLGALLGAVPEAERDSVINEAQRGAWDEYFQRFASAWQSIKGMNPPKPGILLE